MSPRSKGWASIASIGAIAVVGAWALWPDRVPEPSGSGQSFGDHTTADRPRGAPASLPPRRRCAHPWLPTAVGTELRYQLVSGIDGRRLVVSLRLDAERTRGSDVVQRWSFALAADERSQQFSEQTIETVCTATDAEVPWTMLLLRAFGARPTGVSFRLPSELRAGDQLEGDARLPQLGASEGLRWERVATVADLEEVELPNGRAHARRLDYTDTSRLASQASSREGTEWLAPGVGLVRLRETVAGRLAYELELSRITRPQGS